MKNVVEFYKKHLETINFIIISCFLFFACFFEPFAYIAFVFCVLLSIFLNFEGILKIVLFTLPFEQLFKLHNGFLLYSLMWITLSIIAGIKYIIEICLKKKKVNLKTGIPILIFLLYILLPIHKVGIILFGMSFALLLFMYLIIEYRKELAFKKLSLMFIFGVILSSLFYVTKFVSPRLELIIPVIYPLNNCGFVRFSGFASHPNVEGIICLTALCFLFSLAYKKEIKLWQFLVLFVMLFIPSYITISRNFIFSFAILLALFIVLYFIKFRKKAFVVVGSLLITLITLICFCFTPTKIYLTRFNVITNTFNDKIEKVEVSSTSKYEYMSEEWWEEVYKGNEHYDPGRIGIWKLYITKWKSSPKSILFGGGVSASKIGRMEEHNTFIQLLYKHGIVGYLLLLVVFLSFIKLKELQKSILAILLILVPLFTCALAESFNFFVKMLMLVLVVCQGLTEKGIDSKTETNKQQESLNM